MRKLFYSICLLTFIFSCQQNTDSREFEKPLDISKSQHSDFLIAIEQPIDTSKNQIYCATLGYAWNEIKEEIKNEITIDKGFEQLELLNDSKGYNCGLDNSEMTNSVHVDGIEIRAKSVFDVKLPFELKFTRNNLEVNFQGVEVESFGIARYASDEARQVKVLFYENDDSFGVELKPKNSEHEIKLYTSTTNITGSFKEMIEFYEQKESSYVQEMRSNKISPYMFSRLQEDDVFSVPVIKFNLKKDFDTLIGSTFHTALKNFEVIEANQRIALLLDEAGAIVESESKMVATEAAMEEDIKPKRMILDKPFLLVMKKRGDVQPYLVIWVRDAELLTKRRGFKLH